ncbi:RhoGAP domain-containing protein [Legionella anisa]|uniref:Rho-GAP domain-containing protein n=1 Tax=Legionella anisa TaxID=28082 RepID=A0AAX0WS87_9GAMM|nr:RhoGAP domain-containing protein [Legionella anisa]AWN74744.1 hypothetical protein DLD14_13345 [Legionella anisa]KTC77541.1 hypothetical protein Lani_0099 [Legionella anisa]MBN5934897.1 hypothetical protein [Legionella anisa]MCW8425134.1 hypothetical protein [Legionella anisa]MCW8445750.1 hypothetical protein [Legionella anisa]
MPSDEKLRQKKIENLQYAALILIKKIDNELRGKAEEGIFRVAGSLTLVNAKLAEIQKGKMDFSTMNQLECANLLKKVLQKLQENGEPLFSLEDQKQLSDNKNKLLEYKKAINNILGKKSETNQKITYYLFAMLKKSLEKVAQTKMPAENLASMIGPNIFELSNQELSPNLLEAISVENEVCADLIKSANEIIKPELRLQGTHYEAEVKDPSENRFHIFNADGDELGGEYQGLKGDFLKSKILLNFKKQLEETTLETFDDVVEELMKKTAYTVLATSQGFTTWFFRRDTSSVKAFREMVAERKSDLEFEKGLAMN